MTQKELKIKVEKALDVAAKYEQLASNPNPSVSRVGLIAKGRHEAFQEVLSALNGNVVLLNVAGHTN